MYHKHALIKAYVNKSPGEDEKWLSSWLKSLVEKINMNVLMGPYCKYLDVEGNRGITGVIVIETSHISVHFWDECSPNLLQMDVYSCKDFNVDVVLKALQPFDVVSVDTMVIDRNDKLTVIKD